MERFHNPHLPSSAFRHSYLLLTVHTSLLTVLLFLCSPAVVHAQWEPDVRLSYDTLGSQLSYNYARCVAANPVGEIHVVWWNGRGISYKRSTDSGTSWFPDTLLANVPHYCYFPAVAVSGQNVHIVWHLSTNNVKYKRSSDGGQTWLSDTTLSSHAGYFEGWPSISVSDSLVHCVWEEAYISGTTRINYRTSQDGGNNWRPEIGLVGGYGTEYPSVGSSGANVHVAWFDSRYYNIHYRRSTDSGNTWSPETTLCAPFSPSVVAQGDFVHLVWMNNGIFYKRSTDNGRTWSPDTALCLGNARHPTIAVSDPYVHVAWYDNRDGNYEIYYKRSSDEGISWSPDIRLTNAADSSMYPSIAISGSVVHVVWQDRRDGDWEIYYKRNLTANSVTAEHPLEVNQTESQPRIIPNPFASFASIPGHEAERFSLYDISGRKVGTCRGDRIGEGLSAGVYFLKPAKGEGRPVRIVKVR